MLTYVNPTGLCQCGCGQETTLYKGKRRFFRQGHATRIKVRYLPEDRGYDTPCWVWQLATDKDGYAVWHQPQRPGGNRAHRFYYEDHIGPIPEGLQIDHLCRVKACVNPEHLEAVTPHVNQQRTPRARFTPELVVELRYRAAAGESVSALAAEVGAPVGNMSAVLRGERWSNIGGPLRKPPPRRPRIKQEQITAIREGLASGGRPLALARQFGVDPSTVYRIERRMNA